MMMMPYAKSLVMILTAALLMLAVPAQAQDENLATTLRLLNQTPARRNPNFVSIETIKTMRILDTNRQFVGYVTDLTLDDFGTITGIGGEISRLINKTVTVYKPYDAVAYLPEASSFQMPLIANKDTQELEGPSSAQALAQTAESVSGKVYTVEDLMGAEVFARGGRYMGKIVNLLFDREVTALQAIILQEIPQARRYDEIAIPFNRRIFEFSDSFGTLTLQMDPGASEILKEFAQTRR